jgi:hypothetical protein
MSAPAICQQRWAKILLKSNTDEALKDDFL